MTKSWIGSACSVLCALAASCRGGEPNSSGEPPHIVGCVVNGASRASYLRLSDSEENAVVRVDITADDTSSGGTCTGVLVAPRWVLTARHCALAANATAEVSFGADTRGAPGNALPCAPVGGEDAAAAVAARARLRSARLVPHDELDLMLIELDTAWPVTGLDVTPLPAGGDGMLATGALAQLAGFGYTEMAGGAGLRRFLVEEIVELDARYVTVDGYGRSGLCARDSGGPLLVRADGGAVFTAGILQGGSSDCLGRDAFTRLAAAAKWIRAQTEPFDGAPPAAPCSELGAEGRCFGPVAAWCAEGLLRGESCGEGTGCGWSAAASGFRCVVPNDDPCVGVSDTGRCRPEAAIRCDAGRLTSSPCSECIRSPQTGVVSCAAADGSV